MKTFTLIGLLDRETTKFISKKRNELSKMTGSKAALEFPPHFSVRNDFKIENKLDELIERLGELMKSYQQMKINLKNYGFYPQWNVVYVGIIKSKILQDLHNEIMNIIQEYRTSWVEPILLENKHFKGIQKEYVIKYGYQFSFDFYSPHITIAGADMSKEAFLKVKGVLEKEKLEREVRVPSLILVDREEGNSMYHKFSLGNQLSSTQ